MYTYSILKIQILQPMVSYNSPEKYSYNYIRYTWLGSDVETLSANYKQGRILQEEQLTKSGRSVKPRSICCTPHMAFNFTDFYLLQPGTHI